MVDPADQDSPGPAELLRAVLDPLRLAVLAQSVEGPASVATVEHRTGAESRDIAAAIGDLRTLGLLDGGGELDRDAFRAIARALPRDETHPIEGPWTNGEADVLERFFDGDRLRSIPSNVTKRRLVLEKIALRFEPGIRYDERDVNFAIQLIHPDYVAIRRYLVDEGFMDRADGAYWRSGGRHQQPEPGDCRRVLLETTRSDVTLRSYDLSMASALISAANDPRVPRWMSDRFAHPYTDDAAYDWITFASNESPQLNFAIFLESALVGGAGLSALDGERTGGFEIGWWLSPAHWGSGITTAAAHRVLNYAFTDLEAMHVFAPVMQPNIASAAVARNIGMTETGMRPSAFLKGGVRYDEIIFSVVRHEWSAAR